MWGFSTKVIHIIKRDGIWVSSRRLIDTLKKRGLGPTLQQLQAIMTKTDLVNSYRFVLEQAGEEIPHENIPRRTINWLIPEFGIGSGGHLNIFRFINLLEKDGYICRICIVGTHHHSTAEAAKKIIIEHFFNVKAEVYLGTDHLPPAWYSFASSWITAYRLRNLRNTVRKCYFVQDFEPFFFPHGSEYSFAEQTYRFGFHGITAGGWLAEKLSREYGMQTKAVSFSFDQHLYIQKPRRDANTRRVFCYCRPPTTRRGLETAFLALSLVGENLPDVRFVFAGWDMGNYKFDHPFENAGLVAIEDLPDLYSQCDVALVLSFTNLSLLPLELMACGCVVVSNSGPNVEWLLSSENAVLADATPEALAAKLIMVLENPELRNELSAKAKAFAYNSSWEKEVRLVHQQLQLIE